MKYSDYLAQTQRLLQNPGASASLYATSDLNSYINQARTYVAGDALCARTNGSITMAALATSFIFSSVIISGTGYQEIQTINQIASGLSTGTGRTPMYERPFPWFNQYYLGAQVPATGVPMEWAQQGQGSLGTVYLYPTPYTAVTLYLDIIGLPSAITSDSDTDVIPDQFSSAVPYMAAYYAYLSAQRTTDADAMMEKYSKRKEAARRFANGEVLPWQASQGHDPAMQGHYGKQTMGGG